MTLSEWNSHLMSAAQGIWQPQDEWKGTPAFFLAPHIRQSLMRYGSMRTVDVKDDPATGDILVTYELITGESRTIRLPEQVWTDERYAEIVPAITQHLGRM